MQLGDDHDGNDDNDDDDDRRERASTYHEQKRSRDLDTGRNGI